MTHDCHSLILSDRFCIKLATTSAGVQAAKELKAEGIATLGTALFSVNQALAASQAGMHAISMYYNRRLVLYHFSHQL
jgi:transaldolase